MNGCKISIGTFSPKGDVSLMGKDCTFENFVNGKMTAAAYWSCEEVASNPGRKHNPLCICGPTGVGKTHLVCALLYKLRVVHPELKSVIVPSETFMNEMIYCLRLNKMEDIRMKYRGCDLFAIDNTSFLASRERTQEELRYTIESLLAENKQVVVISSDHPNQIAGMSEAVTALMQGGLVVDMLSPDYDQRIKIIEKIAMDRGIELPDEVIAFTANLCDKSVRVLAGAIHRLDVYAHINHSKITLDLAKNYLPQLYSSSQVPLNRQ